MAREIKVGDKLTVKSEDWYRCKRDSDGYVKCGKFSFGEEHSKYCGKEVTATLVKNGIITIEGAKGLVFSKGMFEIPDDNKTKNITESVKSDVRISKITGKPVRKYNRKKETTKKKLEKGTIVIAYNKKDKSDFVVGEFISHEKEYVILVGKTKMTRKHCMLYSHEKLDEIISLKKSEDRLTGLTEKLRKMIMDFSDKNSVRIYIHFVNGILDIKLSEK